MEDKKIAEASLMLDVKGLLNEFKDYSPKQEEDLNKKCVSLIDAYKDVENSTKIVACARTYILKKYEEKVVMESYYQKIETEFFLDMASMLADDTEMMASKDIEKKYAPEANGKAYEHFEAHKMCPFIAELL